MRTDIFSYTNIKGSLVKNRDGQEVGSLQDVLLDSQSGKITCILLATGGFLGMGEKQLPIPYEALSYQPEEAVFYTDIQEGKFRDAPQLENKKDFLRADNNYIDRVYQYYGIRPGI